MNDPIYNILPETDSVPLVRIANGNSSKLSVKSKDVFPPEGALLSCQMSAFLNGFLEGEVYLKQTPGFESAEFPHKVYRLIKAL
jgi:hypothetical protein